MNNAVMTIPTMRQIILAAAMVSTGLLHAQRNSQELVLEIQGRVSDGQQKLDGCQVTVYDGNEVVGNVLTGKGGRFRMALSMDREFALLFTKDGYQPKSILIDSRAKLPEGMHGVPPLDMELSLLPTSKLDGADTDVLDFPFALIRFDRKALVFLEDRIYTEAMMRASGAALLVAGRAAKH